MTKIHLTNFSRGVTLASQYFRKKRTDSRGKIERAERDEIQVSIFKNLLSGIVVHNLLAHLVGTKAALTHLL